MADSLTEIMVERLYRCQAYLVERNVPLAPLEGPQFESDLDLLAVKHDVILVNCKDFISNARDQDKIWKNLEVADHRVREIYAAVTSNKPIIKMLVYGGGCNDKKREFFQSKGIVCKTLGEVFAEYLQALESHMNSLPCKIAPVKGNRWYRTGNLRGYDKLFQHLLNKSILTPKHFTQAMEILESDTAINPKPASS